MDFVHALMIEVLEYMYALLLFAAALERRLASAESSSTPGISTNKS